MTWDTKVFRYCERGVDPSFWAEPLNAVSNGAFIIAAVAAAISLSRDARGTHARSEWLLIGLLMAIGVGSFLFHTFATRWAALADVVPIGVFMLAYLGYALRRFIGLGWVFVAAGLGVFVAAMQLAEGIDCRPALLSVTAAARGPCLNGTVGYLPAFAAMVLIGFVLQRKGHAAARYLLTAAAVFLMSMFFRTVDIEICALTRLGGRALGTHFLWHVLNATTLYLLVVAAIRHGAAGRLRAAPAGPVPRPAGGTPS
ncbi:MAG: ceramidase domain-containing protein [Hyphomicrobiaceae bacterium]